MRQFSLGLVLLAWQTLGAAATEPVAANVRAFSSVITRSFVRQAVEGAAMRLRKPECARVLSDFSDAAGRPLGERLETLGVSAEEYVLKRVWFYEGRRPSCSPLLERKAVTQRGSRVVFICSDRFVKDPYEREVTIIHEMLHSLGLGEDPPSSREITRRVATRCGG